MAALGVMPEGEALPRRVLVITRSAFFTPMKAYPVVAWKDGAPKVRNEAGGFTWLVNARTWAPVVDLSA